MAQQASSSHSTSSSSWCSYDVFLSFRGEDTRKTFTDHLYTAFVNANFRTFRDNDELERGEDIKPGFKRAIEQSRSSVVVFSKDYASSKWCLNELVMILKLKKTSDHVVLPVFYDVDPSHLRKQTGSLAKAFSRHQKVQSFDTVKEWRQALAEAADLAGMVLQNEEDGHEAKFIQKIVKVIEDKLRRTHVSFDPYLIGIHSRVQSINSWLQDGSKEVGILVIYGMHGIGKTTMAKFVYKSNFEIFERHSFLENIRETAEKPNGLIQIQKQLLHDITNGRKIKIYSTSQGMSAIEDVISSKRVLLVLDDVDDMDQLLGEVIGMQDRLYPGSKIIVTTTYAGLLNAHQQVLSHNAETLNDDESLELFSLHAFGQDIPTERYMDHSRRVVQHCGGLPLALKVLGSSLSGKSVAIWESTLNKLETIPNGQISQKLKLSYDSLQDTHDQDLFLHIACFFIGMDRDDIVRILDECDFFTDVGIQNLMDRYLVTLNGYNQVQMHHMIRDMGRGIVRLESKEPGERSRLWHHKDSFNVLTEKNGTKKIEGLILNMQMHPAYARLRNSNDQIVLETNGFAQMHKLKLLQLSYVQLNGCYKEFSTGLRWLCWFKFPLDSLPSNFPLESLVALEMCCSSLRQVWKGTELLPSLKILNLSHSLYLTKTPDFSFVPKLERLILKSCESLIHVDESIGNLEGLVHLNMEDCKSITKLPRNISMLTSLETLIISGCSNLSMFSLDMREMESLKVFEADGVPVHQLLTSAEVTLCPRPNVEISRASYLPRNLVDLRLSNCNLSNDDFPRELGSLSSLKILDLGSNPICSLPDCVRGITGLDSLSFYNCTRLKSLVRLPTVGNLSILGCKALEKVTFQSFSQVDSRMRCIRYTGIRNVDEVLEYEYWYKIEPIEIVDMEMINLLGLGNLKYSTESFVMSQYLRLAFGWRAVRRPIQGLQECGIFSTFLPGNEVPQYGLFSHKSKGSLISFTVPVLPNRRFRGLNIFSVYAKSISNDSPNISASLESLHCAIFTKVSNKSKGLEWIYGPSLFGDPGDGQDVIWLSHWKFRNDLEGGDEVTVSVMTISEFQVEEFGIQIVYHEQEDTMLSTQDNTTDDFFYPVVIGGDLSRFLRSGSGTYLLRHRLNWLTEEEKDRVLSSVLFKDDIGDHNKITDQDEEQQSDKLAAHETSSNANSGGGAGRCWKVVMIMAAIFFLSLLLVSCKLQLYFSERSVNPVIQTIERRYINCIN